MKKIAQILKKVLLIFYITVIHIFAALFIYQAFVIPYFTYDEVGIDEVEDLAKKEEYPAIQPFPSIAPAEIPADINASINQNDPSISVNNTTLMIPVAGIKRDQLQDTYTAARSEGRVHNAIDVMAAGGTPVIAASDGEIAKFFDSERGGTTIYQFSPDKHFIYYYAHLQKRADNIKENDFVKQGTVIGYVGDTGNSGTGNFHLHFEIMISEDSKNYWKGTDINPYPLLKNGIEAH